MAVNKVQYGNQTIMDITDTSATPNGVVEGQVFYSAAGTRSTGTLGDATQSTHGLMSTTDKTKLDAFSAASTYAPIASPTFTTSITLGSRAENSAIGTNSVAIGSNSTSSGEGSLAHGTTNTASGPGSYTGGYYNTASNYGSHAEGVGNSATGYSSHAEGNNTSATGTTAHAEGYSTSASGNYSHAQGNGTIAASAVQFVGGKFNVADTQGTYAEIIGNGIDTNTRKNIRVLDWNGNQKLKGDLYVGCNDDSSSGTKVATITQLPSVMTGATSNAAGTSGLVPIPASGSQDKCLTGDGTWKDKNLVILQYGTSTWTTFWAAFQAHQPILCFYHNSGSSNTDAGRYCSLVYYNNSDNTRYSETLGRHLSSAEFQYYKSPANSTLGAYDQIFCYKLFEDDYWETITRNAAVPIMTGATSSVDGTSGAVPTPTSTDINKFLAGDGTWKSGGLPMVILSYGNSTWNDFLNAYNNNVIVYCRASSADNPASGSQTRMAFMAYVNDETSPSEVEFQYYRSLSSHSASKLGDEVYVYKLNSYGTWSVTKRYASLREIIGGSNGNLSVSFSNNKVTIDGGLPAVTSSDNGKILQVVDGVWTAVTPS